MRGRSASPETLKIPCDVCGSPYEAGPHRHNFHKLRGYDICVCSTCYAANWDGWGPMMEPKILKILQDQNREPPKRNAKGWLPREF